MRSAVSKLLAGCSKLWPPPGGVTVLTFHLVGGGTSSPVDIPTSRFASFLDEIAATASVLDLETAIGAVAAGTLTARDSVVLTFDDAFRNFFTTAWPELHRRGLPSTLYVPSGFVDGIVGAPLRGAGELPACSWDDLRVLRDAGGVTFGSHTIRHPDLRSLEDAALSMEIVESKMRLEEQLNVEITTFAYPRGLVSPRAAELVGRHYTSAMVRGGRRATARTHPLRWQRSPVTSHHASVRAMVTSNVWLEEWIAATTRSVLR